jgi:hypothetical protein
MKRFRNVVLDTQTPSGVAAKLAVVPTPATQTGPIRIPDLRPGESVLVTMLLDSSPAFRPTTIVLRAVGATQTDNKSAVATAEFVGTEPFVAVTLSGATRMTDHSPAYLTALIKNLTEANVRVDVRAEAGRNEYRLALHSSDLDTKTATGTVNTTLAPKAATPVFLRVDAQHPVRRAKSSVTVVATARPDDTPHVDDVTAQRELDVDLAGTDLLPSALGITSVVAIPGILFVLAVLQVQLHDRRRLYPVPSSLSTIWENKIWLLVATAVSLAASWVHTQFGFTDLLDSPTFRDIFFVSVGTAAAGALASWILVKVHRHRVPLVNADSGVMEVLNASARSETRPSIRRSKYKTEDGYGLFVHHDKGCTLLTPKINYSRPDAVGEEIDKNDLRAAVKATRDSDFDGRFADDDDWIKRPLVVADPSPPVVGEDSMLNFKEFEK